MPALITHYEFALRVFSRLRKAGMPVADREAAVIGAQGPDIFFFHRVLPWEPGDSYAKIGSRLHKISPALLFEEFRRVLRSEKRQYGSMLGYIEGFFCHYALDRATHPYVLWAQERLAKDDPSYGRTAHQYHFRIESALDTMTLRRETGRLMDSFRLQSVLPKDHDGLYLAVGQLYRPVLYRLFGINAPSEHLALAPRDMRHALFFMTDRTLLRQKLVLRPVEKLTGGGHFATSLMRPMSTDDWDYANERHAEWTNPFDPQFTSTDSFFDLYELAADEAVDMIAEFLAALPDGKPMQEITQDRGFASDLPGIYEEKRA